MTKEASNFISHAPCNHPFYAKLDDGRTVIAIKTSKNEVLRTAYYKDLSTGKVRDQRINLDRIVACSELGE